MLPTEDAIAVGEQLQGRFGLLVVGSQQAEMPLALVGEDAQRPQIDPGIGQRPQDAAQDARFVGRDDVELGLGSDIMHGRGLLRRAIISKRKGNIKPGRGFRK